MKIGKTCKTFSIMKMNKTIDFHMQALRKICQNIVDSILIRENTSQGKPVFWHISRSEDIIGCKGMLCQKLLLWLPLYYRIHLILN